MQIENILYAFDEDISQLFYDYAYIQRNETQDNYCDDFLDNPDSYLDELIGRDLLDTECSLTSKGQAYLFTDMFYLTQCRYLNNFIDRHLYNKRG